MAARERSAVDRLRRDERAALLRRRRRAGYGNARARSAPLVGLALSGGGVRSATFAFGVLRGLAMRSLLTRIDLLSTVSGGGYIGAMLGRLVGAVGIERAQALLAQAPSDVLDWLRRNGRYLTPAGSRDIGIAIATFLRAAIAIHGEVMFAVLPLALLVVAPHLSQHRWQWLEPLGWEAWRTLWWPIALLWAAVALPGVMAAYWVARDGGDPAATRSPVALGDAAVLAAVSVLALGVSARVFDGLPALRDGLGAAPFGATALWSVAVGIAFVLWRLRRTPDGRAFAVARLRNRLTVALRACGGIALGLCAIGALDLASWWLLEQFSSDRSWLWGGLGLGGAAAVLLRTLANPIQQLLTQAASTARAWAPRLLNLGGVLAALALLLLWLTVVQWLVFAPAPIDALGAYPAWLRWSLLSVLALAWWLLGAGHEGMANTSSLHSFYRARLTRAYLAIGNLERGLVGATVPCSGDVRNVTEVVKGDDCELLHYRPEARGGPLHLINACLNQTRDDASGLYNADRKGTLVTASARGLEIGPDGFVPWGAAADAGTLGRWIAVSGAAAAPGAGSYTSRGWALMLFLLGVRLGHWMRSPLGRDAPSLPKRLAFAWKRLVKPMMLWCEGTATFAGRARPWWYLSDGGHFENSGVYALLKRHCDFIIVVDTSADATYQFADIENLVRKARIDLDAEIEFYPRDAAAELFSLAGSELTVLGPEDLIDNASARGVLLARVRYRRSDPAPDEHHGTLLVVKPNLHGSLDVDLLAYAQRSAAFPHESTGDQSFDEAQWESYHRLGEDIGACLHDSWLAQLPGWRRRATHRFMEPARLRRPPSADAPAPAREPPWRRKMAATAIGTTLGLGASGTLLLSLWQAQDTLQRNAVTAQSELRQLFTDVSRDLRALDGSCPEVAEHTVMQMALLRDLGGSNELLPIERQSIARLVERIDAVCRTPVTRLRAAEECLAAYNRMQSGLCIVATKQLGGAEVFSYWQPLRTPADAVQTWGDAWALITGAAAPVMAATGNENAIPANPAAATPPNGGTTAGAVVVAPAPASASPTPSGVPPPGLSIETACAVGDSATPIRLYVQIHDETAREVARRVRDALLAAAGERLTIGPAENMIRSAELRHQRKPVPWPQPTFIVHDAGLVPCARALKPVVSQVLPPGIAAPWVSELPRSLKKDQRRVIELWLPPLDAAGP